MGLDMYLYKRTYVKQWAHQTPDERTVVTVTGAQSAHIKSDRIAYVTEQVAYWRKANAVHAWFVEHCQNGVDECQTAHVDAEHLVELRDLCQRLLDTHAVDPARGDAEAAEHLPPRAGFFFGSTELDDWYWQDVRETAEVLTEILAERGAGSATYLYESSW